MIREFNHKWFRNKDKLEKYISTHKQNEYASYDKLFELIVHFIINEGKSGCGSYSVKCWSYVNDGDDKGTIFFITPINTYRPMYYQYIQTYVEYGSCEACDALKRIYGEDIDSLPNKEQVKDYMTLCLHIVQRFQYSFVKESNEENEHD